MAFKAGSLDLLGRMGALEKKAGIGRLKLSMFDILIYRNARSIIRYTISAASWLNIMCCNGFRGNHSLISPGSIRLFWALFYVFLDLCGKVVCHVVKVLETEKSELKAVDTIASFLANKSALDWRMTCEI